MKEKQVMETQKLFRLDLHLQKNLCRIWSLRQKNSFGVCLVVRTRWYSLKVPRRVINSEDISLYYDTV